MEIKTVIGICEICGKEADLLELGVQEIDSKEIKDVCVCRACTIELHSGNKETHDKFIALATKKFNK